VIVVCCQVQVSVSG